jgi:hypothetical protein
MNELLIKPLPRSNSEIRNTGMMPRKYNVSIVKNDMLFPLMFES